MDYELERTEDGSYSIRDAETGELQHNRAGAYTEALVNFVRPAGLLAKAAKQADLQVLDVCFGLGYNTFVFLEQLARQPSSACKRVQLSAIESDPSVLNLVPRILEYENFVAVRDTTSLPDVWDFGETRFVLPNGIKVALDLIQCDVRREVPRMRGSKREFDAVFHDPFSPRRMCELWTYDLFKAYYDMTMPRSGVVLTYSSAGAVRGGMQQAGFSVWKTAGVGDKSGGTLGCGDTVPDGALDLDEDEIHRLSTSSAVPYRDPTFSDSRESILARRGAEQQSFGKSG